MLKQFPNNVKSYKTIDNLKKALAKAEKAHPGLNKLRCFPTVSEDGRYVPTFLLVGDQLAEWFTTLSYQCGFCVIG